MLIESEVPKKAVKVIDIKGGDKEPFKIPVNDDFYNDPPDERSIPYMLDHEDEYEDKLKQFKKHNKTRFRLIKKEHAE